MKVQSALIFACAGYLGGLLGELWRLHQGGRPADLGFTGSVFGLAVFGVLFAAVIYFYGAWSRLLRGSEWIAAYAVSALVGLPFWFILLPLHELLHDRFGFPDLFWLVEVVVLCALSFEIIRFFSNRRAKA